MAQIRTLSNLVNAVVNLRGCQFAHIVYEGKVPEVNKTESAQIGGAVTKVVSCVCQLNYNYENAVNNRLEKQGQARDFVAQSLPWGVWHTANKIISHKDKLYLRFYCANTNNQISVEYKVNGKSATSEQVQAIKEIVARKAKPRYTQNGLQNPVEPRVVEMANIISLEFNGDEYTK